MDFKDLKRMFPHATSDTWHRHSNGGGWIENTATVADTAYVGPDALVCDQAGVYDQAEIYWHAQVRGRAEIYGQAQVRGRAEVYDQAQVCGTAQVYDQARVYGQAEVYGVAIVLGRARIYGTAIVLGQVRVSGQVSIHGGIWSEVPLMIKGTRHTLCVCSPTEIAIGCEVHSVEHWLERYEEIGKANGYTDEDIAEYRYLIDVAAEWMKVRMPACLEQEQ